MADAIVWWYGDHQLGVLKRRSRWRMLWLLWILYVAWGALSMVTSSVDVMHESWITFSLVVAYLWHLLILPFLLITMTVNLLPRLSGLMTAIFSKDQNRWEVNESRRHFIAALLVAPPVVTAAVTGWAWFQLNHVRVREIEVEISDLPADLEGFRIAHLSDIHIGRFMYGQVLDELVQTTNELRPDLIALTGDLVNFSLESLPEGLKVVQQLKARYGVYLCEGNHDAMENVYQFRRRVKNAGFQLLVDEAQTLSIGQARLRVIGTRWTGKLVDLRGSPCEGPMTLETLQEEIEQLKEPGSFHLVLSHHPHSWLAMQKAQIPLTLSGHSHGGQLMLDEERGLGPLLFRYWSGLYQLGNSSLVVSNGVGNWFPLRINAPSEIIHLTLRRV